MSAEQFPPGLILVLGAALLALLRGGARKGVALALPVVALAASWQLIEQGAFARIQYLGMDLAPVRVHSATPVFATIFCLMLLGGTLYAWERMSGTEMAAAFVYAGGALGVAFAGDLLTLFVFWEAMTLASTVVVWSGGTDRSYSAGIRYFGVHAFGGVLLLGGIVLHATHAAATGEPDPLGFSAFVTMSGDGWMDLDRENAGPLLILLGMLVNAGGPPLSAWVGDAYPEASVTGMVFLSAFTTKTAVFTLMVGFPGTGLLVWVGLYMALYGVVYALLENDMRRILAYSIVNQVGFMVCGIGIGTELAIDGAAAHAFAHIIYKALLLMTAGVVLHRTGLRKCTELGGLYRTMPVTLWCAIVGALSISSFPLTSGFTTKSMILDSVPELADQLAAQGLPHEHLVFTWFALEAASAGVFLHAGIKYPWFVFFQKDSGLRPPDASGGMKAAMVAFAAACVFLGVFPGLLYGILPYAGKAEEYGNVVYGMEHVTNLVRLLSYSGLAFFVLLPLLRRTETITLDWDWLWRSGGPRLWRSAVLPALGLLKRAETALTSTLPRAAAASLGLAPVPAAGAPSPATGSAVLVVTWVLLVYLAAVLAIL